MAGDERVRNRVDAHVRHQLVAVGEHQRALRPRHAHVRRRRAAARSAQSSRGRGRCGVVPAEHAQHHLRASRRGRRAGPGAPRGGSARRPQPRERAPGIEELLQRRKEEHLQHGGHPDTRRARAQGPHLARRVQHPDRRARARPGTRRGARPARDRRPGCRERARRAPHTPIDDRRRQLAERVGAGGERRRPGGQIAEAERLMRGIGRHAAVTRARLPGGRGPALAIPVAGEAAYEARIDRADAAARASAGAADTDRRRPADRARSRAAAARPGTEATSSTWKRCPRRQAACQSVPADRFTPRRARSSR